jgi:hypothetical protein
MLASFICEQACHLIFHPDLCLQNICACPGIKYIRGGPKKVRRSRATQNKYIKFVVFTAKFNSEYYCDLVLKRGLLCHIQAKCGRNGTL